MRRQGRAAIASALAPVCAVALAMCQSPTQITVTVYTDVGCERRPSDAVTLGALLEIENKPSASSQSACDAAGRVGSLVIVPSGSKDEPIAFKIVQAMDGRSPDACTAPEYKGCIVARRALRFLPHTNVDVPVWMRASCIDVKCDPSQTCVQGACVSPTIGDPSRCTGNGCGEDTLGGARDGGVADATTDAALDAADATGDTAADAPGDTMGDAPLPSDAGIVCNGACNAPLAAFGAASCAIVGAQVQCWGTNTSGELGRPFGGTTPDAAPVVDTNNAPITGAAALSATAFSACASRTNGAASCWGYSDAFTALLGAVAQPRAATVAQLANATEIAVGGMTICWRSGSSARCAGNNDFAQAGAAPDAGTGPFVVGTDVVHVASGHASSCVLTTQSQVRCFGDNAYGNADPTNPSPFALPKVVDLSAIGVPVDVAIGRYHACAILSDLTVACWGDANYGALGHDMGTDAGFPPAPVYASGSTRLDGVIQLALGDFHTCALRKTGDVWCWGTNANAQLGRGADAGAASQVPAPVVGLSGVRFVAAGNEHTCARDGAAHVWCWGRNDSEQLGVPLGTAATLATPHQVF